MTPQEAWSGRKPAVDHFRIFGCIAYAHVPDEKRKKLEDKSLKCVFLGVSETSKAYKLYDPLTKKVVVSRDVIFDENQTWLDMGRKDHCESADSCRSWRRTSFSPYSASLWAWRERESSSQAQQEEPVEEDHDHNQRNPRTRKRENWMVDYKMDYDSSDSAYFAFFMDSDTNNCLWRSGKGEEMEGSHGQLNQIHREEEDLGAHWSSARA